jgi:hypothetical protein
MKYFAAIAARGRTFGLPERRPASLIFSLTRANCLSKSITSADLSEQLAGA